MENMTNQAMELDTHGAAISLKMIHFDLELSNQRNAM